MRILLVQDASYLPSFGGGNKASRYLMAALAARGHDCAVLAKAVSAASATRGDDATELAARGVAFTDAGDGGLRYVHDGVAVTTFNGRSDLSALIAGARADCVIVSDDKCHALLEAARGQRVALAVHTHMHLPFGPDGHVHDDAQLARMRGVRIIAASRYIADYLASHARLESTVLHFPVYDRVTSPETGPFVTMINPCTVKGLPIFLQLADALPHVSFAAVPTWGASADDLAALRARPNVTLLRAADDVGEILRRTRVLLVPSLIAETFGHVTIDAMLRGIPVLASNLGGLPEGKLGVDYLLPVRAAHRDGETYAAPEQDAAPWLDTLQALLGDEQMYARCANASRAAATAFVDAIDVRAFEEVLAEVAQS